ncbi:hypothetical protein KOI40_03445 [Aestuariicella sp. G3-2]|uniref:hypothetical protein n=1 Tax=Pseudomaricurvus albidus TaxID=2842452 RepID=UPI001C0B611D|nr:hypothetical protein [Aestuariicella albida]MBU3068858.1 hypothetical protein [Aestuariicella albida]
MQKLWLGACALLFAATASAGIPQMNYSCPGDIEVHADRGGPVFINGKEANLKKFSDSYYEAKRHGTTISISRNPDESMSVSYATKEGRNGVCKSSSHGSSSRSSDEKAAKKACGKAFGKKTGHTNKKFKHAEYMTAESGAVLKFNHEDHEWTCSLDRDGEVWYLGKSRD